MADLGEGEGEEEEERELVPFTCRMIFTLSMGLARNCPPAPASIPDGRAFLEGGTRQFRCGSLVNVT